MQEISGEEADEANIIVDNNEEVQKDSLNPPSTRISYLSSFGENNDVCWNRLKEVIEFFKRILIGKLKYQNLKNKEKGFQPTRLIVLILRYRFQFK